MTLNTRHDGSALSFYERHGWQVDYVIEDHYLRQDYAMLTKMPEAS